MDRVEGGSMGRHALPLTDEEPMPAFAPPVSSAPPPPAPHTLRPAFAPAAIPVGYGFAPAPPVVDRDEFTALSLIVPQQQSLPIRALVWGIVAMLLNVTILPSLFAIGFGVAGGARARRLDRAGLGPQGRGMSIAGLTLGIVGAATGVLAIVLFVIAMSVSAGR
jgi:hypothetical protein